MKAAAWIASRQSEITADLIELANLNSGSDNLSGLYRVADWLEDRMDLHHAHFQRIGLPPRRVIDNAGDELAIETGPMLRWDFNPDCQRKVLLAIHYDTVFPSEDPFQQCELLTSDRLQGPGVADAKGGIMVIRSTLQAIQQYSLAQEIGWTVVLNPDEEVGSPSSRTQLETMASEFDFGLLFEPAMPTGELVAQRKGSGTFTIVVHGRAAHAGRHFEEGRNAVVELCRLLAALDALNGVSPDLSINVGHVQGGGPVNVVPATAVGRINIRAADESSAVWFQRQLEQLVRELDHKPGFRCRSFGGIQSPPKPVTHAMRELMNAIEQSTAACGAGQVHWRMTGGVCDGNKLAAAGLPNVDTLGPVGDCLHSRSEWVQLSSIVRKSQIVVDLLSRYSTGELSHLDRPRS